jgi:hypothetical protein
MQLKHLYLLLTCYAFSLSSFSQGWVLEESDPLDRSEYDMETEMEIGVEGGPALTTSWGHQYNTAMEGQYYVGVYYRAQFEPWFGFQVGTSVEKVGTIIDVTYVDDQGNPTGTGTVKYRFDFLTCPIMWKFSPLEGKFKLNFSVGGFFSYMFKATSTYSPFPPGTPNDPNPGQENSFDEDLSFANLNGGAILGAGVDYNFDFGLRLGVEVRDHLGLVHLYKNPVTPTFAFRTNSLLFLGRVAYGF